MYLKKLYKPDGADGHGGRGRRGQAKILPPRPHCRRAYVLASAKDGYQVVYTLTEIDPAFTGSLILRALSAS
ncbi:MAG: hypothetical protein HYX25_10195 [Candidatus Solibacter usitatus]|nr:hypothetical protein [Candidatus Solibacter usitatus]